MNLKYLTIFVFTSFVQTLDFNFNRITDNGFLFRREMEFIGKEQTKFVSLTVPIIFSNVKFTEVLIDRDGFICFGNLYKHTSLKDVPYRNSDGKINLIDGLTVLTPFKISWNYSYPKHLILYRILNIKDILLSCSDKDLIGKLREIIRIVFRRTFSPREVLLISWINMTASGSGESNTTISFEQAILTDGEESFQIINYLPGFDYSKLFLPYEPLSGIFSKIRNHSIRISMDLDQYPWKNIKVIQLDNLSYLNSNVEYQTLSSNDLHQVNLKCTNSYVDEIFNYPHINNSYNRPSIVLGESVKMQNDIERNPILCDSRKCSKGATCNVSGVETCCVCNTNWIGDGVSCIFLPFNPESPIEIVYEGNLSIEKDNKVLDKQKFRLTRVYSNQKENDRVFLHVEYSTNVNYMLITFANPSLFLLSMWISATPLNGGKNLLQLSAGLITSYKSLCSVDNIATFYIEGNSSRLGQDFQGRWEFLVKYFSSTSIINEISDLEDDSQIYTLQFRRNNEVIIENLLIGLLETKKIAFKCRTEIRIDRGCIQEPDFESKNMFLIIQRISLGMNSENGIFYVGKALVTDNPCLVSEITCPIPNTVCILDSLSETYKCICNPEYTMIRNKCEKTSSNFKCYPTCHINATCIGVNQCQCNNGYTGDGYDCFNCSICDKNAECLPYLRICQCKPGYVGNGYECRIEDNCYNKCHKKAYCTGGYCKCKKNLIGDGIHSCFDCLECDVDADCSPIESRCYCRPGFIGTGYKCTKLCDGVSCHKDAICENLKCLCKQNFKGDGINFCFNCSQCHKNAICQAKYEKCVCRKPFIGDGIFKCSPLNGLSYYSSPKPSCSPPCVKHGFCNSENKCECKSNYFGNPLLKCHIDCSRCHRNAKCMWTIGRCICHNGYVGDGFICNKLSCLEKCHENALCLNEKCTCKSGYEGDGIKSCVNCIECLSNAECIKDNNICISKTNLKENRTKSAMSNKCKVPCHKSEVCVNGKCIYKKLLTSNCFNYDICDRNAFCNRKEQKCECNQGYKGDGISCMKESVCKTRCHINASCVNGFCICSNNLIGDGIHSCFDCDTCSANGQCDPYNERCICNKGYEGDGIHCFRNFFDCRICSPFSDCDANNRKCVCKTGFEGNGIVCTEQKSCMPRCHTNAICIRKICICLQGFIGDGVNVCFRCSDCDINAICNPFDQGCLCKPGFIGNGKKCIYRKI